MHDTQYYIIYIKGSLYNRFYLHIILLCLYKTLTCVSVSIKLVATSNLLGLDKYLFCLNCRSSSKSCWLVKAVRGLLVLPNSAVGPPEIPVNG